MRALLLEDDAPTRESYKQCLADAGHEVLDCATIERATNILRTTSVDVLILDLVIGNSNSLVLAQFAGYAAPDAEIILITGTNRFPRGEVFAEFPGIDWMLHKPVPLTDLEALVAFADQRRVKRLVAQTENLSYLTTSSS